MKKIIAAHDQKHGFPRICAICGRDSRQLKCFQRHHLRYAEPEIVVDLCFEHHNHAHGRQTYHNYFEKIYGKDLGPYVFARDLARLYEYKWGDALVRDEATLRLIKFIEKEDTE